MIRQLSALCAILIAICSALALDVRSAGAAGCEDFVPSNCIRVKSTDKIPAIVKDKCYVLDENSTGANVYDSLNVLAGGKILFVDPGKARTIDFQVSALLVEKGGVVQAGSPGCPFGKAGRQARDRCSTATIRPSRATVPNPRAGHPVRDQRRAPAELRCFPGGTNYSDRSLLHGQRLRRSVLDDDGARREPQELPARALRQPELRPHAVGLQGARRQLRRHAALFGYKGAKPLQDTTWTAQERSGRPLRGADRGEVDARRRRDAGVGRISPAAAGRGSQASTTTAAEARRSPSTASRRRRLGGRATRSSSAPPTGTRATPRCARSASVDTVVPTGHADRRSTLLRVPARRRKIFDVSASARPAPTSPAR